MSKTLTMELNCPSCGKAYTVEITPNEFEAIKLKGLSICQALPKRSAMFREHFISGYCQDCQSRIFNCPKDGEDWGDPVAECEVCGCPIYKKDNGMCPQCKTVIDVI